MLSKEQKKSSFKKKAIGSTYKIGVIYLNYVVFDLELNSKPFKNSIPNEIIEIGAVKLDNNLQIIDRYQSFIKPKHFSKLFRTIKQKTKIQQTDIDSANSFSQVFNEFKNWVSSDVILFSWGYDDYYHLKSNCLLHGLELPYENNFIDLQKQFSIINKFEKGKYSSLKDALLLLDIPLLEEGLHRADMDAEYTAKIFINVFDKIQF